MVTKYCIRLIIICVLLTPLYFTLVLSEEVTKTYNLKASITPNLAWTLLKDNQIIIIDVRTRSEWKKTGVIPNSILISMHDENHIERSNFIFDIENVLESKSTKVAIICASGKRSSLTRDALIKKGYTNITDIQEGFMGKDSKGWLDLKLPLSEYKNKKYLNIN